jgi:protease I
MPGSVSLLCLSTTHHASLGSSTGLSERRAGEFLCGTKETTMPLIPDSRILIVATDGFEEWELFGPREILRNRGADVQLASLKRDPIQATVHDDPGKTIRPDLTVDQANADDFDAVILPGGVRNPDQLRMHVNVIQLIRDFDRQGKPIGAICHAPWLLAEADLLRGRRATSWPSIRTDIRNAGATVVDEAAVTDGNIVTSRNPDDVEEFTAALIELVENAPEVSQIRQPSELPA